MPGITAVYVWDERKPRSEGGEKMKGESLWSCVRGVEGVDRRRKVTRENPAGFPINPRPELW